MDMPGDIVDNHKLPASGIADYIFFDFLDCPYEVNDLPALKLWQKQHKLEESAILGVLQHPKSYREQQWTVEGAYGWKLQQQDDFEYILHSVRPTQTLQDFYSMGGVKVSFGIINLITPQTRERNNLVMKICCCLNLLTSSGLH